MKTTTPWRLALLAPAIVLGFSFSATQLLASSLWGANWGGGLYSPPLNVGQIDAGTGAVPKWITIPGGESRSGLRDFASDPFRYPSVVWSLHYTRPYGYELLSFNPHQQLLLSKVALDDSLELQGLAIDPTTGLFYATSVTSLYQVDPATGHSTLIGAMSLQVDGALGFDLDGNLFGVRGLSGLEPSELVSVNKSTGETMVIAELDVWPADIAVRPEDGVMYGLGHGNDPTNTYSLFQIDLTTGEVTDVGPSLFRPAGLAFTLVPEPATFALAFLAIAAVATFARRRPLRPRAITNSIG